jgi:hypothetical protein
MSYRRPLASGSGRMGVLAASPAVLAIAIVTSLASPAAALAPLRGIPFHFEPNRGQLAPAVRFAARGGDGTLLFLPGETILALGASAPRSRGVEIESVARAPAPNPPGPLRMRWLDARLDAPIVAEDPLAGRVHHFRGSDPARWQRDLPTFARLRYRDLYPGIDWQRGTRRARPRVRHVLRRERRRDRAGPGGRQRGQPGSVHATGVTDSSDFPLVAALAGPGNACANCGLGLTEAFVTTLDASGSLVFSSFLGGSSSDYASGVAVDGPALYVLGDTYSSDFPTQAPFQPAHGSGDNYDVFVARIAIPEPGATPGALASLAALALLRCAGALRTPSRPLPLG